MTASTSLQDLMVNDLKDIYSAEHMALRAYPKLVEAVQHPDLKEAMQFHLEQTQDQVERLDEIFDKLGYSERGEASVAMQGLIQEAEGLIHSDNHAEVRDTALLAAAQKIAHYEIAGYGTVITYAEQLGRDDLAEPLKKTLHEEKQNDKTLSKLAEDVINLNARDQKTAK